MCGEIFGLEQEGGSCDGGSAFFGERSGQRLLTEVFQLLVVVLDCLLPLVDEVVHMSQSLII